ncbi:hypothetical protein [Prauserella marina]|uniref:hypothetical protein n=1 Tax=Prauserella marina TaxID=530584 RepID=UPI00115FF114|nr:hypothetical protein [Prauserella marina]
MGTACSAGPEDGPRGSPSASLPAPVLDQPPSVPVTTFGGAAAWTEQDGPFSELSHAEIRGDVLLVDGVGDKGGAEGVAVVDAGTGAPRWSVGALDELPGGDGALLYQVDKPTAVISSGDEWWPVVEYYRQAGDDHAERGLAVLSADDGSVVRTVPVVKAAPESEPEYTIANWRAGGTSAVVVAAPSATEDEGTVRTVGIDLLEGAVTWEREGQEGIDPATIAGGVVIGRAAGNGDDKQATAAYDLRSGEPKWSLADRYPSSYVDENRTPVAAGVLAVYVTDDAGVVGVALVDTVSGEELTRVKMASGCASDAAGEFLACGISVDDTSDRRLLTVSADGEPKVSGKAVEAGQVAGAFAGRTVVSGGSSALNLYDAAGNPRGEGPRGRLLAISEGHLVVATGGGYSVFALD